MTQYEKLSIDKVEKSVGKKFRYRSEIEVIIETADKHGLNSLLDELMFKAKFISHAYNILNRLGIDSSNTVKLAAEFKQNMEQSILLIRKLINQAPLESQHHFNDEFRKDSPEYLKKFMDFLNELSWLKNYMIDNKNIS